MDKTGPSSGPRPSIYNLRKTQHKKIMVEKISRFSPVQSWNLQVYLLQVLHLFLSSFTLLLTS